MKSIGKIVAKDFFYYIKNKKTLMEPQYENELIYRLSKYKKIINNIDLCYFKYSNNKESILLSVYTLDNNVTLWNPE